MSSGAEDSESFDADHPTATLHDPPHPDHPDDRAGHPHHHVLIEPQEDRWRWRRRIRQNPHQLAVYRVAVAIAGLLLICLGFVSGPLPGPGGIPLVLLGLAIWASEFEWAHRLMMWFKSLLHRFRQLSRGRQALCWVAFFATCGLLGYCYLLTLGVPGWLPDVAAVALRRLPGI